MSNKVLLTGARGFLGRQILRCLQRLNCSVRAVVRHSLSDDERSCFGGVEYVFTRNLFSENLEWHVSQCEKVDTVIHAAWYAEPGKYLSSSLNTDCLVGSLVLAKAAVKAGVKRFVGIGTCFEYDLSAGILTEASPLKPTTAYASAKASLFRELSKLLPQQSVEFAWCRPFYLYGEAEDERRLVAYLHKQLKNGEVAELGSGRQIRDFMDVSEAGRLIAGVSLSHQQGPINICTGIPITVRKLAEDVADLYGRRDLLKFGLRKDHILDPPCVLGIPNYNIDY